LALLVNYSGPLPHQAQKYRFNIQNIFNVVENIQGDLRPQNAPREYKPPIKIIFIALFANITNTLGAVKNCRTRERDKIGQNDGHRWIPQLKPYI
jgi:hypothetical protein